LLAGVIEEQDEMAHGREKSDGRVVPEDRRKAVSTAAVEQGGKAITASECAGQIEMPFGTADSPQGADGGAERDHSRAAPYAVPKPKVTTNRRLRPMTLEEIAAEDNLRIAFVHVASNKGAAGPDRQSVPMVREHLDDVTAELHRTLLDESYRPGDIRRVWIPKACGGERGLGIPNVIDRIVQQAAHQVLGPQYEPTFHASSHGFRPERSCHTAIAEAKAHLEEGYEWVVDLDLSKFFDRVHHERLLARLAQRVHDARVIRLIRRMLKAKVVMPDGVVVSNEEGTPQGGPLSPLLSNIVLDELDRELSQRGHRFVRYADDCNIYVRSERAGYRAMQSIVRFIEKRLRLVVNMDKSAVARPDERHFVGFRLRYDPADGSVDVLLSSRSKKRVDKKLRELTPRTWGQRISRCIDGINAYWLGWIGFFGICTEAERQKIHALDAHARRRLRVLQLHHWKRRRTMITRLTALGVKRKTAMRSIFGGSKSWWALSHSYAVDRGLDPAHWKDRGLISVEDQWDAIRAKRAIGLPQLTLQLG
jgi:RNA-directed DNA polymerase